MPGNPGYSYAEGIAAANRVRIVEAVNMEQLGAGHRPKKRADRKIVTPRGRCFDPAIRGPIISVTMTTGLPFIVVIVDRDEDVRSSLTRLLRENGYAALACGSAGEARRMLHEYPWDLALIEKTLPDSSGVDLCEELKSEPEFATRYLIAVLPKGDSEGAQALDRGADDFTTKTIAPEEVLARIRSGQRIVDLSKKLLGLNRQLELLSITDGLTKLYNRRYCEEQLNRAFEHSMRYLRPLSFVLFDTDHFKQVNDTYGHRVGDRVLEEVSATLAHAARSADLVARYGGDEFAIIAPETGRDEAFRLAERMRLKIEATAVRVGDLDIPMTLSAGIASAPAENLTDAATMIDEADRALYRAKEQGRNRTVVAQGNPPAARAQ